RQGEREARRDSRDAPASQVVFRVLRFGKHGSSSQGFSKWFGGETLGGTRIPHYVFGAGAVGLRMKRCGQRSGGPDRRPSARPCARSSRIMRVSRDAKRPPSEAIRAISARSSRSSGEISGALEKCGESFSPAGALI